MHKLTPNRSRSLSFALILGMGVTLALLWLLGIDPLPLARADSFGVTKFTDSADENCDADCSLREAIIAANTNGQANDTITLGTGTYVLTITGTNENAAATGDLDITNVLTITGDGPGQTIIDANGIDRVFEIRSGASTVVISGVAIINGDTPDAGGGIYNYDADLILTNTVVSSNTASDGGGMYNYQGNVMMNGGQILSNSADYSGGGVYADGGSVMLNGGEIRGNVATYDGGGVYVNYDGSVTSSAGQILSNTADNGSGGGVYVNNSGASFTQIGASTTAYNVAAVDGGGVYVEFGSATLSDGQILGNDASGNGGGVFVEYGSATLNGAQIRDNDAWIGGGVYVNIGSATLSGGESSATLPNWTAVGCTSKVRAPLLFKAVTVASPTTLPPSSTVWEVGCTPTMAA